MRLSDLQARDIVNLKDGKRLGRIIDVEIDANNGNILFLVIEQKRNIRSFVGGGLDTTVKFSQITRIGEDVILVDL